MRSPSRVTDYLRIGIFATSRKKLLEACSDRLLGYNPIGVASGRFMQATGTSTNDAEISYSSSRRSPDSQSFSTRFLIEPYRIKVTHSSIQALLTPGILA